MKGDMIDKMPISALAVGANLLGLKYRLYRYSGSMRGILNEWRSLEGISADEMHSRQVTTLKGLLRRAAKSPFYKQRFRDADFEPEAFCCLEDLQAIPTLTRDDIRDNFDRMIVPGAEEPVVTRKSSGTTGEPIVFQQPRKLVYDYAYAALYQAYAWHGVAPLARRASLAGRYLGRHPQGVIIRNLFENQLLLGVHALRQENARRYLEALRQFKPQILQAHPSAMILLRDFASSEGLDPVKIPVIAFTGEHLPDEERRKLADWFQADVFGQYGSGEHHIASAECRQLNGYHINPEFSFCEVVQTEIGGEIVSTSLLNGVMPLIRYRIGDMADRIDTTPCPCGCSWPRLMGLQGRADDALLTARGRVVAPVVLRTGLAAHFKGLPPFAIIQHKQAGTYTLKLFTRRSREEFAQVATYLSEILGPDVHVALAIVPPDDQFTARGKRKMVVRE